MKRRAGLGGSMRSVVGFLSQRGLHGDPLLTQDFQRRRLRGCRNLYKKDLLGHFGCVNAIEFSNNGGQWLVSVISPDACPESVGRGGGRGYRSTKFDDKLFLRVL
ncbi:DDB1- and CUL4-associated factor 5 [Saguinus oedipus]|uniref:DDB1- and CUL4-associated factor 5 n=1 Tax=Saguinus oedipus TaxID=9490 RepID=A0ABQ9V4U7_SAGOE|nr:DDB1- and CUL4-associated factor 5 [Saguinus oedipus]